MPKAGQQVTPFLWFDGQAEEAVKFYVSIFPNSRIGGTARYDDQAAQASGRPAGSVMTVTFELNGQEFVALNGGSRRAVRRCNAAGSRTASTCPGKWFPPS